MAHEIIFRVTNDNDNIPWEGNIDEAFREFFEAKREQLESIESQVITNEEKGEVWPPRQPYIGDGVENAFESSHGFKIWYEDPPHDGYKFSFYISYYRLLSEAITEHMEQGVDIPPEYISERNRVEKILELEDIDPYEPPVK